MANDFSKEEIVAFEQMLMGFDSALVMSKNVNVYKTDQSMMERTNDVINRPMPYIMTSFDGTAGNDISALYTDATQLTVPASIDTNDTAGWILNALELRDALQEGRIEKAAEQILAAALDQSVMNSATNLGSIVVPVAGAATGFSDISLCDSAMTELGIETAERYCTLDARNYALMAANLAARQNLVATKTITAYEEAYVGRVSRFETYTSDYINRQAVAAGVTVTVNGATEYYVPKGVDSTQAGKKNVDNRFQTIALTVSSGAVAVGDSFTIAGVNSVHLINKKDTGQLKTFRITSLLTSSGATGDMQITPPIISGTGATDAELQYKNVTAAPADGAALVFLNIAVSAMCPFWHKKSIEILPGRLAIQENSGVAVRRGSTDQGFELVMQKFSDIDFNKTKYRVDLFL